RIESRGAARFGRFSEMQVDGGSFEVEAESAESILKDLQAAQNFAFEAVLIPQPTAPGSASHSEGAPIFSVPGVRIAEREGKLFALFDNGEQWISSEPMPATPFHLVLNRQPASGAASPFERLFINGRPVSISP